MLDMVLGVHEAQIDTTTGMWGSEEAKSFFDKITLPWISIGGDKVNMRFIRPGSLKNIPNSVLTD